MIFFVGVRTTIPTDGRLATLVWHFCRSAHLVSVDPYTSRGEGVRAHAFKRERVEIGFDPGT